jgi:hypothetical protein
MGLPISARGPPQLTAVAVFGTPAHTFSNNNPS